MKFDETLFMSHFVVGFFLWISIEILLWHFCLKIAPFSFLLRIPLGLNSTILITFPRKLEQRFLPSSTVPGLIVLFLSVRLPVNLLSCQQSIFSEFATWFLSTNERRVVIMRS